MVKDELTRAQIRHDHFDLHLSIHEVARRLHIGRNTVRHWLRCKDPKPYPHSETRVFLDSHQEELKDLFCRCRENACHFQEELRDEYGVTVGLRTVQRFVNEKHWRTTQRPRRKRGTQETPSVKTTNG